MKSIKLFLSAFFLSLIFLVYFTLSCAIPGLDKDLLTQVPDSWNGRYARETNLSEAVLEIKEGKIFSVNAWTLTEVFPENSGLEDGKVYYFNEICQIISGDNILGYKRNADSSIEYFDNSSKIKYVKIGDAGTTTTTTILSVTTTIGGVGTTIPQLSYNNSLTATSAEIERGAIINYSGGYIQFVIPKTIAEEAYALDPSVKILKHHGEYIDVWNWATARPGVTPYIDGYYKIVGSNVYATDQIPLSVFTSETSGAIFDAWTNPTKYEFGIKMCDINGAQLPEAVNGGSVYNWIAKSYYDNTQWAIKTSNFDGEEECGNAYFDISLLYSAGTTTTTYPAGTTSTSVAYVTSTTTMSATTTVSGASTSTSNVATTTSYTSTSTTIYDGSSTTVSGATTTYVSTSTTIYDGSSTTVSGATTTTSILGASTTTTYAPSSTTIEPATTTIATTTTVAYNDYSSAVDNIGIAFVTNENVNWLIDNSTAYSGSSSIKSGDIDDYGSTYIEATVSGISQISFYWKVDSETGCDYLSFYVDGSYIHNISGQVDWSQYVFDFSDANSHILKWVYSKDGSLSTVNDCGWIDNITLTVSGATTTTYEEVTSTTYEEVTSTTYEEVTSTTYEEVTSTTIEPATTTIATTTTTVTPIVINPIISYDATNDLVTITSATEFADIYYTENGGTPSESDILYEGAFYPVENSVIRAVAYKSGYINSNVVVKAVTPKRIYIKCVDYVIPAVVIAGCSDSTIADDNYVLSPVSGQSSWYYYEFEGIPKNTNLTFTDLHIWDNFEGEFHNFSLPNNPPSEDAWYNPAIDISYSNSVGAPDPVGGITVHVQKPAEWSFIYLYSWYGVDPTNDNGGWPGELMTEDTVANWYYDSLSNDSKIIFNNNTGNQTIDLSITPGVELWVKNLIMEWTTVQPY